MLTVMLLVPCSAVGAKDTQPNQSRKNKPGGVCRKACCSKPSSRLASRLACLPYILTCCQCLSSSGQAGTARAQQSQSQTQHTAQHRVHTIQTRYTTCAEATQVSTGGGATHCSIAHRPKHSTIGHIMQAGQQVPGHMEAAPCKPTTSPY
jgi:hypothetical protein